PAQPTPSAQPAVPADAQPVPDAASTQQPDSADTQNPAAQQPAASPRRRELLLNSPDALPRSTIGQPGGGAEPLR
ncbi:hypothetical protein LPZ50_20700, partial [Bordetella petrii]|nr:hypothetical protein [Bordetella petrii]